MLNTRDIAGNAEEEEEEKEEAGDVSPNEPLLKQLREERSEHNEVFVLVHTFFFQGKIMLTHQQWCPTERKNQ